VHPETPKLKEAVKIWEELTASFVQNLIMGDVEIKTHGQGHSKYQ
jgi:hypothetical protein